jgi:hypothetical protein
MKCSNGKWKYGVHGHCVFDTLAACKAAAAAIHIKPKDTSCSSCNCNNPVTNTLTYVEKSNPYLPA